MQASDEGPPTSKARQSQPLLSIPVFKPDSSVCRKTLMDKFCGMQKELADATIEACKTLRTDDPGIFFMFAVHANEIHAILGLPGSPVATAANAAASVTALRDWILTLIPNQRNQLVAITAASLNQGVSITNLSGQEFAQLLGILTALTPWGAAVMASGRSAGSFHIIQGSGAGSCTITRIAVAAFVYVRRCG